MNDQITGNHDLYALFNNRSSDLFEYSNLDENEEIEEFTDVNSVYLSYKY